MPETQTLTLTVVFALFPGVTQLDFTGPHQILAMLPGAKLVLASSTGGDLTTDTGLTFAGVQKLADIERCEVICIPGGMGTSGAMEDEEFLAQVRRLAEDARYVTSVCTGSLLLGAAGLLQGKRAACHWGWRELLSLFGATPDEARVVRDGNVITGGGVTAGIDFALTLAAEIAGEETAQFIQLLNEYAPAPPFNAGRPETAPAHLVAAVRARAAEAGVVRVEVAERVAARLREFASA